MLRIFRTTEFVTNHVVGKDHTAVHRKAVGGAIMAIGVGLAHLGAHGHILLAIPADLIGYSLHALGFVPFIKSIENANDN